HESVLALLPRGHAFGKEAILKKRPLSYNAEVVADADMLLIPRAFLKEAAQNHEELSELQEKIITLIVSGAHQMELSIAHLSWLTSAQRVACFLLRLGEGKHEGGVEITLPYEKSLVAELLGRKPETLSRALIQLMPVGVGTNKS